MTAGTASATPLAAALLAAAARSVGRHHGEAYRLQVRYLCEDLDRLRQRLRALERDIERLVAHTRSARCLTTIEGIGPQPSARLVATFGDFSGFASGAAVASYVGAIPALRQSGKRTAIRAGLTPIGARRSARQALDAGPRRRPEEPVAARLLRPPPRARQAAEGRADRRHAQTPARHR